MSKILSVPKSNLIEHVAGQLAATWYEIGRGQGMKSKWPTARLYARNNIEKFIPKAIEHLLEILNNPTFPDLAKQEIFEALMERHNDPTLQTGKELPNIDVTKLIAKVESSKGSEVTPKNLQVIKLIEDAIKKAKPDYNPYLKAN